MHLDRVRIRDGGRDDWDRIVSRIASYRVLGDANATGDDMDDNNYFPENGDYYDTPEPDEVEVAIEDTESVCLYCRGDPCDCDKWIP